MRVLGVQPFTPTYKWVDQIITRWCNGCVTSSQLGRLGFESRTGNENFSCVFCSHIGLGNHHKSWC